uniref:Uncharacterized protein n=1 Tax=Chenopodium quinoa TaxID=63459 RepID=A0A803LBF1_CHEQI
MFPSTTMAISSKLPLEQFLSNNLQGRRLNYQKNGEIFSFDVFVICLPPPISPPSQLFGFLFLSNKKKRRHIAMNGGRGTGDGESVNPPLAPPLPGAQPKRVLLKSKGMSSYEDQGSVSTTITNFYNPEDMEDYILHLLVLSHVYVVPHLKRECEVQPENDLLNIKTVSTFSRFLFYVMPQGSAHLSLECDERGSPNPRKRVSSDCGRS